MTDKTTGTATDCAQLDRRLTGFNRDGYWVERGFLGDQEMHELRERLALFITQVVPRLPAEQVFYEKKGDQSSLKQVQALFEHDDYFAKLFFDSPFERLAETLLEGPVVGKNMQYFNKPPTIGRATPPHQDGYYFMIEPCQAATLWLAVDEVDEHNGSLRYVRGSHRRGLRPHRRTATLGFSQGIAGFGKAEDRANEVLLAARPGDLLAHHALTIHRADGNQSSTRSRRALGFIYYSASARIDQAAHAEYQRRLAKEMREQGRI